MDATYVLIMSDVVDVCPLSSDSDEKSAKVAERDEDGVTAVAEECDVEGSH